MNTVVLERLRDLFLAGEAAAGAGPVCRVAERVAPATLGVLVTSGDAPAAGAALGLAAAAAHRAPCAVVCRWTGAEPVEPPRSGMAGSAARRLAQRLAARSLAAGACGRIVTVALPASGTEARAATERALAAGGDIPLILTVAGARPSAFDPLLATLDRLIVVPPSGAPEGLEHLAIDAAARLGRGAGCLHLPATGAVSGRLLAATGLPISLAWRKAAATAVRGGDG
ncbi:MAG: hypothetical protein ABW167_08285 [Baekduia sp.]